MVGVPRLLVLILIFAAGVSNSLGHGGGLDRCGGHHDRKRGGYHVHQWDRYCACYPKDAACGPSETRTPTRVESSQAEQKRYSAAEAASHVGEVATVCGKVASTRYASSSRGQPTFINLEKPYPAQIFTLVIWGEDRVKFGQPEEELRGKSICVRGTIETYRGIPQIVAKALSQLEIEER